MAACTVVTRRGAIVTEISLIPLEVTPAAPSAAKQIPVVSHHAAKHETMPGAIFTA